MKPTSLITAAIFIAASTVTAAFATETITFDVSQQPGHYASNLKSNSFISLTEEDGEGMLTFRSLGGRELIIIDRNGAPVQPGDTVEIELRTFEDVTFGVFLRGEFVGDMAYMTFLSATPDGTIRLSLNKTRVEPEQRPGEDPITYKHARGLGGNQWFILRIELTEIPGGDGVGLRETLIDKVSGTPVLQVEGEDTIDPIPAGGMLAFRFFTNHSPEEGRLDIRSITLGN
jgi:hypothetical protein